VAVTAGAAAERDVIERVRVLVQEGVEEAEGGLAGSQTGVIEETDDTAEGGGRARSTLVALQDTLVVDAVAVALGGNVGEATTLGVVVGLEIVADLV